MKYNCFKCGFESNKRSDLSKHFKENAICKRYRVIFTSIVKSKDNIYDPTVCLYCSKQFNNKHNAMRHTKKCDKYNDLICTVKCIMAFNYINKFISVRNDVIINKSNFNKDMISNYKTKEIAISNIMTFDKIDYSDIKYENNKHIIYLYIPKIIKNIHFNLNNTKYMILYYPKLYENNIYIHQYHYWIKMNIYDFLTILIKKILHGLEDNGLLSDDNQDVDLIFNFFKTGFDKTQNKISNNVSNEIKQMINSIKAVMFNNKHLLEQNVIDII